MLAADTDREKTARLLDDALAAGRLTVEEHHARIDTVYKARTYGELEPLTADIPQPRMATAPMIRDQGLAPSSWRVRGKTAIFRSTSVRPAGPVRDVVRAYALFGNIEVDLRDADIPQQGIAVAAQACCGQVVIVVPPDVRVQMRFRLGRVHQPDGAGPADGPIVGVGAITLGGSVTIRRKPRI